MDWLTFTSVLISSLAWPLVVVVLAVMFRKPIASLVDRLESAKGPGFEIGLRDEFRNAEANADAADLPPAPQQPPIQDNRSPSVRIFEAWRSLETFLNEVFEKQSGRRPRSYSELRAFINNLAATGKIPNQSVTLFNNLRSIRNQAVHPSSGSPDVTEAQAKEFADLTARFMEQMKQLD